MVMALLICWHACNKHADNKDRRFAGSFLVVAPGITIRDRLRVLLPSDPENYYRTLDLVPADLRARPGPGSSAMPTSPVKTSPRAANMDRKYRADRIIQQYTSNHPVMEK